MFNLNGVLTVYTGRDLDAGPHVGPAGSVDSIPTAVRAKGAGAAIPRPQA